MISPQKRLEIVDALRRGTVPRQGLDLFAVGLAFFTDTLEDELATVETGGSQFKAVRGEYGCGKTFFIRWLQEQAKKKGFAATEVQVSEMETPLHRLETVYRRLMERLSTANTPNGAFRDIVDHWFYTLEEDLLAGGEVDPANGDELLLKSNELMEKRLLGISRQAPAFAAALRGYREALARGESALAEGLLAWLSGQPNVAASVKRFAGIKGDVDHFGALNFLQGLLLILRDSGHPGLVLCLDEVETLQRTRTDVRDKGLNALRQLMDEIDAGRFPGLYVVMTGTPSFFDSPQGIKRLPPLSQRLHVDFSTAARYDNPRAVQIRLSGFDLDKLSLLGRRIRDIFVEGSPHEARLMAVVDDGYLRILAEAVAGRLGGKIGIAPRIFLKKLIGEVLDRVDQFPDFDPRRDYALTLDEGELSLSERQAASASTVDEIEIDP